MSLFVVYKSALHGQQFPCQIGKGNRMKHLQIYQGLPVWRMPKQMRIHMFSFLSVLFSISQMLIWAHPVIFGVYLHFSEQLILNSRHSAQKIQPRHTWLIFRSPFVIRFCSEASAIKFRAWQNQPLTQQPLKES